MNYSCLVVSNDLNKVEILKHIFSSLSHWRFQNLASDYDLVLNEMLKKTPNLIYLDLDDKDHIQTSFNFIKDLNFYISTMPATIALSKIKDGAYSAIKHGFLDYLLCPLRELDIRKSLAKFDQDNKSTNQERLCLKSYSDYQFLNLEKIVFLKADNNTTDIYLADGRCIPAFKTMKHFENYLPGNFFRIHNSYMINMNAVQRINFGKSHIIMNGDMLNDPIPFSRSYKANVNDLKRILAQSDIKI